MPEKESTDIDRADVYTGDIRIHEPTTPGDITHIEGVTPRGITITVPAGLISTTITTIPTTTSVVTIARIDATWDRINAGALRYTEYCMDGFISVNVYSYLSASIGFILAALFAGYRPNIIPTITEIVNAMTRAMKVTIVRICAK